MANKYYQANELYQSMDKLVNENAGLMLKLQVSETVIANLKSSNERLVDGFLSLTEQLENVNIKIDRLNVVMKSP